MLAMALGYVPLLPFARILAQTRTDSVLEALLYNMVFRKLDKVGFEALKGTHTGGARAKVRDADGAWGLGRVQKRRRRETQQMLRPKMSKPGQGRFRGSRWSVWYFLAMLVQCGSLTLPFHAPLSPLPPLDTPSLAWESGRQSMVLVDGCVCFCVGGLVWLWS